MSERRPSYDSVSNRAVASGETRSVDERQERSGRRLRKGVALGIIGTSASLGLLAACNNEGESETVTKTVQPTQETVVVNYIDRELSEQHVIGFGATVDGIFAGQEVTKELLFGIDQLIPEIDSVTINNLGVTASFCYDGGTEQIKETTYVEENRRVYDVTIDASDVRVCAKKDPGVDPIIDEYSNHATDRTYEGTIFEEQYFDKEAAAKEDKLGGELITTAENVAKQAVIDECGPEVLEVTEDDFERLVAVDLKRSENETVNVNLQYPSDEVIKLSTKSDVQDAIDEKIAQGWDIKSGVTECEIPQSVLEGDNASFIPGKQPPDHNDPPQGVTIAYDSTKGEFVVKGAETDTADNRQQRRIDDKPPDNEKQQLPVNETRQKVGQVALISLLAVTPFVAVDTAGTFVKTGEIRNVQELAVDATELPQQAVQFGENVSDIVNDLGTALELFSLGEENE